MKTKNTGAFSLEGSGIVFSAGSSKRLRSSWRKRISTTQTEDHLRNHSTRRLFAAISCGCVSPYLSTNVANAVQLLAGCGGDEACKQSVNSGQHGIVSTGDGADKILDAARDLGKQVSLFLLSFCYSDAADVFHVCFSFFRLTLCL